MRTYPLSMQEKLQGFFDHSIWKRVFLGWNKEDSSLWYNGAVQGIIDVSSQCVCQLAEADALPFDLAAFTSLPPPKTSYIFGPFPPQKDFFTFAKAEWEGLEGLEHAKMLVDISDHRFDLSEEERQSLGEVDIRRMRPVYLRFGRLGAIFIPKNIEYYNGLDVFLTTYLPVAIGGRVMVSENPKRAEDNNEIIQFGHQMPFVFRPVLAIARNSGDFDLEVSGISLRPYFISSPICV